MGIFDYKFIGKLFKMESTIWLTLLLAVIATTPVSSNEPRVVCYYTNWSVYRPGTAKFNPQNINPYLCTHLIYAFGGFTKDNTLKPFDKYQDIEKGGYAKFTGLKTYNKNLKTLLAIGGWNEGSSRFSPMVASKERRKEFVRNAIKFLRQNRFDGLDLDWEYPAFRDGSKPKDRENYSRLVRELREEFERESEKTGKPRLLLTMAVPAGIEYIQKGYDVKTLNRHLDWMNLLSYDYHSAFEPAVNHHAPLYPLEEPNEYSVDTELNIDYTIKFYLENGADRNKLVLGIPTYGRSYTLFNTEAVEIGSPADGPGEQGDATREKGYLAYYEICEALKPKSKKRAIDSDEEYSEEEEEQEDEEWTVMHPNPNAMGPIAFKGNQWVGYDDIDIVRKKAEYVAENGLGGIMFWSIDNDDFRGTCHSKPYPLIEAAKEAYIQKLESSDNVIITEKPSSVSRTSNRRKNRPKTTKTTTTTTTTTEKPTTTRSNKRKSSSTTPAWGLVTPSPPTTPDPGSDFKCVDEGFFPHPRDCKKYFWCLDSGPSDLGIVAHQFTCPSGLYFNKAADSCDFARNVLCKTATTTKAPTTRAPTTKPPTTKTTVTTTTTTTTRKPIKISTRNSLLFRTTTTTTPAPEPESDEEYQDEVSEDTFDDAEDPKVIKELIDLIKKVGGIEQLEKQLHLSEASASTDGASTTTPSSFNKKLYQKVLERTRGKNKYSQNSVFENNRRAPQSQGGELAADGDQLPRKDRPQYVTINRQRSSTSTTAEPESEYSEEEEEDEEEIPEPIRARPAESSGRVGTTAKPLQYVNIRRGRPTAATSEPADDTASRNALFERQEPAVTSSPSKLDVLNARKENLPEYVTMRRQRPTTEETTTVQYQAEESEEDSRQTALEREISSQPQYNSIIRTRSTTFAPVEESTSPIPFTSRARSTTLPPVEEPSSPEPTTVLTVQISSLINSLNSEIDYPVPETTLAQATEPAEAPTTTSTTVTTTTTTTTTAAPSSIPPRRTVLRRRGSTSTTTTTTTASTPVSSTQLPKRTFQRRTRPPVVQPEVDIEKVQRGDSKYTKRNETRPATTAAPRRNERPPNRFVRRKPGGANATTLSTTSVTTSTTTRRPLRIANRRRPTATTRITTTPTTTTPNPITTAQPTTASPTTSQATTIEDILDVEPLQDIGDTDAIEEPNQEQRGTRKNNKVRRPLVTLKESPGDQNPSATNEEENKRQSKKYSSSFKQNQLDDLLKLKSRDLETTTEFKTTAVEDFNAETALAIAAHQLFSAPLPVSQNYDDEAKTTRTTQSFKYTSPQFNQFTDKTPYEEYPSTPTLRDTVSNVDFTQTTNPDTRITQYETTRTTDFQVTNPSINTFAGYSTLSTTSDSSELTSVYEPKTTGTLARANEETRTPSTNIRFNVPEGFTSRYTTGYTTTDFEPSLTTSFETQRPKYVPARASTFGYSTLTTENSRESTTEFETPKTGRARYRPTTTTDSSETPPGVVTVVGRGSGRYSSTPYPAITNEYLETTRGIFEDPTDFTSPKVSTFASPIPTGFTSRQRISSPSVVNAGYTGVSPRSSSRRPGSSEKYGTENYGYSTVTYSPASREPSFFTRDYLLESPVTKTYDEEYQYLTPVTTPKPRKVFRKKIQRRITTTARPTTSTTVKPSTPVRPRTTTELYEKISRAPVRTYRPIVNYDYYDDSDEKVANRYAEGTKVILHEKGTIECLDVGNFPHPTSCKKFISCARMEGETIVAWEYICPKGLSFDPVGGICNWSAGLGCDEKDV